MRVLLSLLMAGALLSACAHEDYRADRERREEWRRESMARPPPCPGASWQEGREYPDGRWDPGRWNCNYPVGYGGSGPYGPSDRDERR